ncbi:hypothetical protein HPP92_028857 [Vanilla planifolia]|uniref:Uncharacterized protein n=1 Tax=Vanilla planifolia TaxID=51239 RepID=A0A835P4C2_VANPL|nr:hypothetical protein HPP92_028857 [Vanilla planifolia]KAG0446406.1 hypothetical protein HPP92_028846 [Vanilla planifolia]
MTTRSGCLQLELWPISAACNPVAEMGYELRRHCGSEECRRIAVVTWLLKCRSAVRQQLVWVTEAACGDSGKTQLAGGTSMPEGQLALVNQGKKGRAAEVVRADIEQFCSLHLKNQQMLLALPVGESQFLWKLFLMAFLKFVGKRAISSSKVSTPQQTQARKVTVS